MLVIHYAQDQIKGAANGELVMITNLRDGSEIATKLNISERQKDILLAGGLLNFTKQANEH